MIQFRLPYIPHLTIGTYTLRAGLREDRKVTSSRYYSCAVCLTIDFCPRFSIRLYLACLQCLTDGRPFIAHTCILSLSLLFFISLLLSLFLFFTFFRTCSLFRAELPSFSISISLLSSSLVLFRLLSLSFFLSNTESLYIFRELLSSYFINIVLRVPPCILGKGRIELHKRVMAVKMKKSFLV